MIKEIPLERIPSIIDSFWRLLTEEEKTEVFALLKLRRLKKHERIYNEGESPNNLLCLVEGKVKIFRDGVGGRSQIMRILREGQYFGYRASIAGEPYVTAAAAVEPSVICEIPMDVVKRIMWSNNSLCLFFIKELATDLGIADRRTVSLTQKHVRGRLAEALLILKETYGTEDDGKVLNVIVTREEMAQLSNMTTANAIRTLSQFVSEKLVQNVGKKLRILDELALRKISRIG